MDPSQPVTITLPIKTMKVIRDWGREAYEAHLNGDDVPLLRERLETFVTIAEAMNEAVRTAAMRGDTDAMQTLTPKYLHKPDAPLMLYDATKDVLNWIEEEIERERLAQDELYKSLEIVRDEILIPAINQYASQATMEEKQWMKQNP